MKLTVKEIKAAQQTAELKDIVIAMSQFHQMFETAVTATAVSDNVVTLLKSRVKARKEAKAVESAAIFDQALALYRTEVNHALNTLRASAFKNAAGVFSGEEWKDLYKAYSRYMETRTDENMTKTVKVFASMLAAHNMDEESARLAADWAVRGIAGQFDGSARRTGKFINAMSLLKFKRTVIGSLDDSMSYQAFFECRKARKAAKLSGKISTKAIDTIAKKWFEIATASLEEVKAATEELKGQE